MKKKNIKERETGIKSKLQREIDELRQITS